MGGERGGRLFEAGRLFELGADSRLGAYSNKYGSYDPTTFSFFFSLPKRTEENASMHITAMNATLMVCYKYGTLFQYLAS